MTTIEQAGGLSAPRRDFSTARRIIAKTGLQSLAGAAGGALHPSLHRHGLRLQRVLAAAVARDRHHQDRMPATI